jgi:hypothetical protein
MRRDLRGGHSVHAPAAAIDAASRVLGAIHRRDRGADDRLVTGETLSTDALAIVYRLARSLAADSFDRVGPMAAAIVRASDCRTSQ